MICLDGSSLTEHFFACSSEVKDSSLHIYVFTKIYGFIIFKVSLGGSSFLRI